MTSEADLVRLGEAVDKSHDAVCAIDKAWLDDDDQRRLRRAIAVALLAHVGDEERMVLVNEDSGSAVAWRRVLPGTPFEQMAAHPRLRGEVIEVVVVRRTRIGEGT